MFALVFGEDRVDSPIGGVAVSECETADFDFEPEIDSAIVDLDENERVIVHEGITGVVALQEEYRSWCVDTQAIARDRDRDRERTAQYGVARVCLVVAPCSA